MKKKIIMKELSIEEKAKAYDEAIKRGLDYIRQTPATEMVTRQDIFEAIFPELKESEDERIRKSLINYVYCHGDAGDFTKKEFIAWLEKQGEQKPDKVEPKFHEGDWVVDSQGLKEFIAWLEKQGEQKPDKVEPKFHEGDWVVDSQGLIHQIERVVKIVTTHTFGYDIVGGGYFNDDNEGVHLWTIEDAKAGDVLVDEDNNIGIYKEIKDKWWHSYIYLGCDNRLYGFSGGLHIQSNTKPATKEQRDILEKAMVDAGYTFDFENEVIRYIF